MPAIIIGMGKGKGASEYGDGMDTDAKADKAKKGQAQSILDAVKADDSDALSRALSTYVELCAGESEPETEGDTSDE